jgi:hypothetical protein
MRGLLASAVTIGLGLVLSQSAGAQERDSKDRPDQPQLGTICGVVAGITTEGEAVIDYRTKRAVEVEAAFLTIVGSPARWDESGDRKDNARASGATEQKRENIYVVWLSPRTKVCKCEACDASGKPDPAKTEPCDLAKLEVGDRVTVKFNRRDESATSPGANHSESMRMKHGRHRILSVDAQEITIIPPARDEKPSGSK